MSKAKQKKNTRVQIGAISTIISCNNFMASLEVDYFDYDNRGSVQSVHIIFTPDDQEFIDFLNDWATRKAAELLMA